MPNHKERIEKARAERQRKRRQGMTLIEIMIVIGIIAMIAGGVAVALLPAMDRAKIKSTRTDAQGLRSAVILYFGDGGKKCPTVDDLVEAKILDQQKRTKDAWDNDFQINCEGGDVTITSAGPDGQMGTEDDIK